MSEYVYDGLVADVSDCPDCGNVLHRAYEPRSPQRWKWTLYECTACFSTFTLLDAYGMTP